MMKASRPPEDRPSKSQRKRDMQQLQDLGELLVKLRDPEFRRISLPEELREAIAACRSISAHEGKRRQLQYVGRLMRGLDEATLREVCKQLEAFMPAATMRKLSIESRNGLHDVSAG
ncbi:MAG: DUF615 domain-containing protein [Betaproteobacteria bacterium]|nr:DUF615 domain-containing protein [Betaproteobacteria bacterium]